MNVERYLRLTAGAMVLVTVALGVLVSPWWLAMTAFVGLNLLQSAFTNWCPLMTLLRRAGVPCAGEPRAHSADGGCAMALEVDVRTAYADMRTGDAALLDVRSPDEYAAGHVPGAVLIPLPELPGRLADVPSGRDLYVICAAGGRSAAAVKLLTGAGVDAHNVIGGMAAWVKAGLPVERTP